MVDLEICEKNEDPLENIIKIAIFRMLKRYVNETCYHMFSSIDH